MAVVICYRQFVVCLVILLAAQRRWSSFKWPAGETTKMVYVRERFYAKHCFLILPYPSGWFHLTGKANKSKKGGVSWKWEKQMLLEEPRGCARPAGTVWWCPMNTSHRESCFLSNSLFVPQRNSDVRENLWEKCSFGQNMQREMRISALHAQENLEHGLMAPFK